jgi:hypothetical protein
MKAPAQTVETAPNQQTIGVVVIQAPVFNNLIIEENVKTNKKKCNDF